MTKFSQGNNKAAKLSNVDILELRDRVLNQGWTHGQACRHYGLHINTVGRIVRGESHRNVPMPSEGAITEKQEALIAQQQESILERLRKDIEKAQAQPNPDRDLEELADWAGAGKFGVNKE